MLIRSGKMVGSRTFEFEETGIPDDEMLSTFTNLFYNSGTTIPDEVFTSGALFGGRARDVSIGY